MIKTGKLVGVCNCECHCGLEECFTDHDKRCEHCRGKLIGAAGKCGKSTWRVELIIKTSLSDDEIVTKIREAVIKTIKEEIYEEDSISDQSESSGNQSVQQSN